jgi:hypothetical protein
VKVGQWTENGKQWVNSPLSMNPYFIIWSLNDGIVPLPEDGHPPKRVAGEKGAKAKTG